VSVWNHTENAVNWTTYKNILWQGQIFDRKLPNSRLCACAVKICLKVYSLLTISPKFCPLIENRGRWTRWWRQFLHRKQFLRIRTKGIATSLGKCMPIEELLPYYGKSRSLERMAGSDCWPEAPKQPFPHREVLLFWVNLHESKGCSLRRLCKVINVI